MDEREHDHSGPTKRFLDPGELPEPVDDSDDDWSKPDYKFPMPPGAGRPQQNTAPPKPRRRRNSRHGRMPQVPGRPSSSNRTQQSKESSRRTVSSVSNASFDPATDGSLQANHPISQHGPLFATHQINVFDPSAMNPLPINPMQQLPHAGHLDPSLFPFDDSSLSYNFPPSLPGSYTTPNLSGHSYTPSSHEPTPQRNSVSSQSPFLSDATPFTPFTPIPRTSYGHQQQLPTGHTPASGINESPSNFESSPFLLDSSLLDSSHFMPPTTLPLHPRQPAYNRATPRIDHRRNASGNSGRPSNFLAPHPPYPPHSRQSNLGSGHRRIGPHSHIYSTSSAGLADQQPLPQFDERTPASTFNSRQEDTLQSDRVRILKEMEEVARKLKEQKTKCESEIEELIKKRSSQPSDPDPEARKKESRRLTNQLYHLRTRLKEYDGELLEAEAKLEESRRGQADRRQPSAY